MGGALLVRLQMPSSWTRSVKSQSVRYLAFKAISYLEYTPWDTAHGFTKGKHRQRWREKWDENGNTQPSHEEHHGRSATKSILGVDVDQEAGKLAHNRRVG